MKRKERLWNDKDDKDGMDEKRKKRKVKWERKGMERIIYVVKSKIR